MQPDDRGRAGRLRSRRRPWQSSPFPVRGSARHNPKQRMDPARGRRLPFEPLRCARFKLLRQMTPLEVDLASRHIDVFCGAARRNPGGLEPVSPLDRFGVHGLEIRHDERYRSGLRAEPGQLGMMPISFCRLLQNRLGEQTLPPQRDQPARIEMPRMKAPETHAAILDPDGPLSKPPEFPHRHGLAELAAGPLRHRGRTTAFEVSPEGLGFNHCVALWARAVAVSGGMSLRHETAAPASHPTRAPRPPLGSRGGPASHFALFTSSSMLECHPGAPGRGEVQAPSGAGTRSPRP